MRTKIVQAMTFFLLALFLIFAVPANAQNYPSDSNFASRLPAYNFGRWTGRVSQGSTGTGAYTITIVAGYATTPDGINFVPYNTNSPIIVGSGSTQETVTPTAVSGCGVSNGTSQCQVTATFTNAHGAGTPVISGSYGLDEALNYSSQCVASGQCQSGGGLVVVDAFWFNAGGTDALITSAPVFSQVAIENLKKGVPTYWTPTQTTATIPAAPATLTATTVGFGLNGANTTGGTYTGTSTYNVNVACVDIMGNEGNASATFSGLTAGTGATNQIGIAFPTCTGAQEVGYTVYISLASGTYNLSYQVPITSSVCALTQLETITPACRVTNSTYGQVGSNAVVSALTVNTAPLHLLVTTASTTSAYIGTPSNRATYAYAPHNHVGGPGITNSQQAYTVATAAATTVPEVIATIPIPGSFMNFVGRTIRICGQATMASAGTTATVQNIEFLWDAAGSNTAGAGVIIGQLQITATGAGGAAENYGFCETFQTTVAGATVTAGSLMPLAGILNYTEGAGTLHAAGTDVKAAAVGSLNLLNAAGNTARIHVVWLHTTGTDGAGMQCNGITIEVI